MTTTRRSRSLLVAASAILAGGLSAATLSPSGATTATPDAAGVVLKAPEPAKGNAWIQGTVQDRAGRAPLGVLVEAFAPGSSTVVASSLTYAGPTRHGDEVDGFFFLVVPAGEYTLKYSSPAGAKDPFRTVRSGSVVVGKREVRSVASQTLTLQRKASVTVAAELSSKLIRSSKGATVTVQITSPDVKPVVGDVEISQGRKVYGEATLARSDKGSTEVELSKLKAGVYKLVVKYAGNDYTASGVSKALKLTVKPKK